MASAPSLLEDRLSRASDADAAWSELKLSPLYDGRETDGASLAELSALLLACTRAASGPRKGIFLAVYVRLSLECGVHLFYSGAPSAEHSVNESWQIDAALLSPFLAQEQADVRAVTALALNVARGAQEESLSQAELRLRHERDPLTAALLRLFLNRHSGAAATPCPSPTFSVGSSDLGGRERLAALFEVGAAIFAGRRLDESSSALLLDHVRRSEELPTFLGAFYDNRPFSTRDVVFDLLDGARVPAPASFALELLALDRSVWAQRSAFAITFLTPREHYPYGPVLSDMTEEEKDVLRKTRDVPPEFYLQLGIGRYDLEKFLARSSSSYKPIPLDVDGRRWEPHLGALLRRTVLGEVEIVTAAEAIVREIKPGELTNTWLSELRLLHPLLPPSKLPIARKLTKEVLSCAAARDSKACELLMATLQKTPLPDSIFLSGGLLVAFTDCKACSQKLREKAVEYLRSSIPFDDGKFLLERLPPNEREDLVLASGDPRWAVTCPTLPVAIWLLETATDDDVDQLLDMLSSADRSLLEGLANIDLTNVTGKLVRQLVLEARHRAE